MAVAKNHKEELFPHPSNSAMVKESHCCRLNQLQSHNEKLIPEMPGSGHLHIPICQRHCILGAVELSAQRRHPQKSTTQMVGEFEDRKSRVGFSGPISVIFCDKHLIWRNTADVCRCYSRLWFFTLKNRGAAARWQSMSLKVGTDVS